MNVPGTDTRAGVIARFKEYRIRHPADIREGVAMH